MTEHTLPAIVTDPDIMMGKPVIGGTRLTVELLLEDLAAGVTVEEMLEAYPCLTRESLRAAMAYAAAELRATNASRHASVS